jgi:putative tryptophan/tyrosine transport system substrate-binding protein
MKCRTIVLIVALALYWTPLSLEAQPVGQVRRIGFLALGSHAVISTSPRFEAFREGLRELGWVEGQNLILEARYAEGKEEPLPELAGELVCLKVEVIVVVGGRPAVRATQHATSTIPIVGVMMGDPVGEGLVASLARPGGNITGLSGTPREMAGKRLELLKQAQPEVTRVGVLANPANHPSSLRQLQETQVAAQALGIQLYVLEPRNPDELEGAFSALTRAGAEALSVLTDPFMLERHVSAIIPLALKSRLPAMYPWRMYPEAGGLISHSVNMTDAY